MTATSVALMNVRTIGTFIESVDLNFSPELLVLVTFEFDQLLIDDQPLIDAYGPGLRVRFRILERDVDLQVIEGRPAEFLGELGLLTVRTAVDVEPAVVRSVFRAAQVIGFDH